MAVDDEHPLRALAFAREPDAQSTVLRRDKGAVKEYHGPVQLIYAIQLYQRCSPDALPHADLTPAF